MHSGESYLAAFEEATANCCGKLRNYKTPVEGDHSYATPIVINRDGQEQILVWGAPEHLTIHATADGKMLFECGGFNPDKKETGCRSLRQSSLATWPWCRTAAAKIAGIKLTGSGNVTETNRVWTRD